jgi:3-methyladenine DNA glycosylase/8-oxoguanine DNA glycosylase
MVPVVTLPLEEPFDLVTTLRPLARGSGDPTLRLAPGRAWRASRTPDGPATVAIAQGRDRLIAEAWGPGADRALHELPRVLGLDTGPFHVADHHPLVTDLARRHRGVRLTRTEAVLDALIPAILEQKVTGQEARRAWRGLVARYGEAAPGPAELRLRLTPPAERLAGLPYYTFHPFGVERRRADLIRGVASRSAWFEAISAMPIADAYARLTAVPGIGPWTAAEVAVRALGDRDAVSVGDFHLKNVVAYALAGEPRADDERMLELLEPWRGERAHVVRLIELSGIGAPRYGPRLVPRRIEAM